MLKRLFLKNYIINFFVFIFIISCMFKLFAIKVFASTQVPDTFKIYDDNHSSYTQIGNNGSITEVYFPYYVYCYFACFSDGNYIVTFCPDFVLVDNGNVKGVDRSKVFKNNSGLITGIENPTFYQMTGYTSSVTFTYIDGTVYQCRSMKVSDLIKDCAMVSINGTFNVDFLPHVSVSVLESFVHGHTGANIENANINFDTTDIEKLITDSNTINSNTQILVSDIKNEIISGSSSQIGLVEEDRALLKRYDIWLVMIAFASVLALIRNSLHQMSRNVRGRS